MWARKISLWGSLPTVSPERLNKSDLKNTETSSNEVKNDECESIFTKEEKPWENCALFVTFCSVCLFKLTWFCLCFVFQSRSWISPLGTRSAWCWHRGQRSKYKVLKRSEKGFKDDWLWEKGKQTKEVTWCLLELVCMKWAESEKKHLHTWMFRVQNEWKEEILSQFLFFYVTYQERPHTRVFSYHICCLHSAG